MKPFVSIICPTMRAGGLNILFDSLAKQTFTNFELVLSDGLYKHRAARAAKEAYDRFLRVVHVEPHPNPFPLCAFCEYANAALAAASGEIALFIVDFSWLPSDLVELHATFHKRAHPSIGMMGPHRYRALDLLPEFPRYAQSDVTRYEEDVRTGMLDDFMWSIGDRTDRPSEPHIVDGGGSAPWDADPKLRAPAGPIDHVCFHAKNESVRMEHVIAINGFDENLDGAHAYQDSDFADRLAVKRGVRWINNPEAIIDIVNPRHVFPFARRLRDHESNREIWQRSKAQGYPAPLNRRGLDRKAPVSPPNMTLEVTLPGVVETATPDKLHVAMIYGEFSSAIHGPFDIDGLYTRVGLTGSESSFFNLARTLAERGHNVVAFCVCEKEYEHPSGLTVMPIQLLPQLPSIKPLDAVVAWNEPDYLQFAPPGVKRIVDQQLNDWGYCRHPQWREMIDMFVFPSSNSRDHHEIDEKINEVRTRSTVIANSVDLDLFEDPYDKESFFTVGHDSGLPERNPHRVVYCSSPDRGLHHLLAMWPAIRARVPDAELRIFYRLAPWLARVRDNDDEVGLRARYIEEAFIRLRDMGVTIVGPVPNAQMARELQAATVLAYPCDPVRYTEGFGCSVLDAAAAGCVPVISEADALPSVHVAAGIVVKGNPAATRERWVDVITSVLLLKHGVPMDWRTKMLAHAEAHSREKIADQWEALIRATPARMG